MKKERMGEKVRIGTPDYLSSRPLVFGLTSNPPGNVELVYGDSGQLANALEAGVLDAALIPAVEFLRGVGRFYVAGPALVAHGRTMSLVLVTDKPLEELRRVAVAESDRTPLAVMRIVLDRLYHSLPDFCVFKGEPAGWKEGHDATLLSGDKGLEYLARGLRAGEKYYDVGELWAALHSCPLVVSLWAYNDESLGPRLHRLLTGSRDYGIRNLSLLSDGVARNTAYDGEFLYNYFSKGWSYHLGPAEENALRVLESDAFAYQLILDRRLDKVLTG